MKFLVGLLLFIMGPCWAEPAGQQEFLSQVFTGQAPQSKVLWLVPVLKQRVETVLQHPYAGARVRYWQQATRTAWILDEVGKEQPITIGVVVDQGKISQLTVLNYRESRGGEVQQNFFTRQFLGQTLLAQDRLSKGVDGITGATMSVAAVQKVARLALLLDSQKAP